MRHARPSQPSTRAGNALAKVPAQSWQGRLPVLTPQVQAGSNPAKFDNAAGGPGTVIEHVTAYASGATIAGGGGRIMWTQEAPPPTERRGFQKFAEALAESGQVGAIPIDVTGELEIVLDGLWATYRSKGDITITRTRGSSTAVATFDLGPIRSRMFDGVTLGWGVQAGDTIEVDLPNDSGAGQTLQEATVGLRVIAPSFPTSTVPGAPGDYDEAVLRDEPDAYFLLRESSGTAAADEQGGANGTYAGSDHTLAGATTPDGFDALRVNSGAGGYVQFGSRFTFEGTQPFTVSIMAKPSGNGANALVASFVDYFALDDGWILRYHRASGPTTTLDAIRRTGGTQDRSRYTFTSDLGPAGLWIVAAIVYDGTDLWAYVNGEQATPVASSRSIPAPGRDNPTNVNATRTATYSEVLEGDFARAAFWSRALTKSELDVHYGALGVVLST